MDDEVLLSSQSADGNSAVGIDCICSPAINHKSSAHITCAICSQSTLLACLQHSFKATGSLAQKYNCSSEWLLTFINHCDLRFICQQCRTIGASGPSMGNTHVGNTTITDGNFQYGDKCKSTELMIFKLAEKVEELSSKISGLSAAHASSTTVNAVHLSTGAKSPPTYANVVSDDVKNAVFQALKEQRKATAEESTIVVYGFPDEDNDREELEKMFYFLRCDCRIIRHGRLGHANKGKSFRPIKVELSSTDQVLSLLSNAKHLKDNWYYAGVSISKWLSYDECKNIKHIREQCRALNSSHIPDSKGRKPFFVISGKIMMRNSSGKLEVYSNTATVNSSELSTIKTKLVPVSSNNTGPTNVTGGSSTGSKNVKGGSQVAP